MRVVSPRRAVRPLSLLLGATFFLSCGGDGGSPSPTPTNVLVTPGADTLVALGETQAFTATVLDANGDPIDGATVTWSSSDTTVVTILPSGLATARKNGAVTVTASAGALQGSAPITVAQVPTTVTITPATGLFTFVGDTLTFTASVLDAGGAPVVPVQKIWTINDNTVAIVDSAGLARAKGAGIAMVTVVAIGPGGAKAGFAAVNATQPVAAIGIRHQPTFATAGEALDPALQVDVRDSGGTVIAQFGGAITVGIDSGPEGAVLRGTKTVHAVNGVASFSGLTLERAGDTRLSVTAPTLAPAATQPIGVAPNVPAALAFVHQPSEGGGSLAGESMFLYAELRDRFGNDTFDPDVQVAVELVAGPPGAAIYGDPVGVWDLVSGQLFFPGAVLHKAGPGNIVRITSPGLLPDTTLAFAVGANVPARLEAETGARFWTRFVSDSAKLFVRITDLFGNQASGPPQFISLGVTAWPYAATDFRGQEVFPPGGLFFGDTATFEHVAFARPGPTQVVVSGGGLIPDTVDVENRGLHAIGDIYAGGGTTCLVGAHYCVGANAHGELGISPGVVTRDSVMAYPDSLFDDSGPYAIGNGVVCGIDFILPAFTPTVFCRGRNDEGQLGMGAVGPDREQLVRVPGLDGAWMVAVGDGHVCALTADSTAACWGRNDHGQLGRGSSGAPDPTPGAVTGGLKYKWIAAGGDHSCAITVAGAMRCWGANAEGELGDSTQTESSVPVTTVGGLLWLKVVAGPGFSCASRTVGGGLPSKTYCWGTNALGQLGDPGAGAGRTYPAPVAGLLNDLPSMLVAGTAHVCVIGNSGLICWGDNGHGQIGNGGGGIVTSPYKINFDTGRFPNWIAAGGAHTCVVTYVLGVEEELAYCWGANDQGQLGDGTTVDRPAPTPMIQ